jgi:2-aminoadipate transaminase
MISQGTANCRLVLPVRPAAPYNVRMNIDALRPTTNGEPLYQQVVEQIESAIVSGEFGTGSRLPAERDLARSLGISRTTAMNAYAELAARGLVRRQVGRGTYVCARPESSDMPFSWRGKMSLGALRTEDGGFSALTRSAVEPGLISFAAAVPARECFPIDDFRAITDSVLRSHPARALGLAESEGSPALREAVAVRHAVSPERVLILNGAQQGLDVLARCLLDPGDVVLMDRPGYVGAIQTFRAAGAIIVGWDLESRDLETFEDLIVRYRPKFFYTTPTFQNPTGQTLTSGFRRDLLDIASRYHLPVIEDDPYRDLTFERDVPRTMRELDLHNLVIQIGTLSKTLAAGLRIGWLIANETIVEQLALIKGRSDVASPTLPQMVAAEFLATGRFDKHVAALRSEHRRRYDAMIAAIERWIPPGALTYEPVDGGLYLWCRYRAEIDAADLLARARSEGIVFLNGETCYADSAGRRQMRLCFSGLSPGKINDGIERLAGLLNID